MVEYIPESSIRQKAEGLLTRARVSSPPISVEALAQLLNARIVLEPLSTDLSGALHVVDGIPRIAVNSTQASTRQRFTIAHEIGHLILHGQQTFVDRSFLFRRDQRAATGSAREEIQANMFAAEVLMPHQWLLDELGEDGIDIGDDERLVDLARRYRVSQAAMLFRLVNLQLALH